MDRNVDIIIRGKWEDVLSGYGEGSVSLVVTDPPYQSTPCDWDERPAWAPFMSEMGRLCGDSGQLWIFVRQPWATDIMLSAKKAGWTYIQEIIWEKQNAGGCTVGTFRKVHENIWHFKRRLAKTFNLGDVRVPKTTTGNKSVRRRTASTTQFMGRENSAYVDDGMRLPKSVVRCRNLHRSAESFSHPTQKPLELMTPLVLYSSNSGDIVLDPFCGTGTSLVACKMYARKWIGVESDAKWHKIAVERLASVTAIEAPERFAQGKPDLFKE